MNLEFELTKFNRNTSEIKRFIGQQLGVDLMPINNLAVEHKAMMSSLSPHLPLVSDLIWYGKLDNKLLLITLPLDIEYYFDSDLVLERMREALDSVAYTLRHDLNLIQLNFGYSCFHIMGIAGLFGINIPFSNLSRIKYFLNKTGDFSLISALNRFKGCTDANLLDYLCNRDDFWNKYIAYLIDKQEAYSVSASHDYNISEDEYFSECESYLDELKNFKANKCDNEYNTILFAEAVGLFNSSDDDTDAPLDNIIVWSELLDPTCDKSVVSVTYEGTRTYTYQVDEFEPPQTTKKAIPNTINIVKDLPMLLYGVASRFYDYSPSSLVKALPKYYSLDANDFKKPYGIYKGIVFADGNLSKIRAVTKFVEAVKTLGLSLSEFKIEVK